LLVLFSVTLFMSAFLLFWVQLMVAKMILPLLGGSPAVWNTCQFFFQGTLLLGYAYGHLTTRWWETRRQAVIHSFLLLVPVAFLPVAVPKGWIPPANANPIPWLLALLLVSTGIPFFVVSTSAPLVQKWFAGTGHPSSQDPYFLYIASNLGSMLGLLSYPILIEPNFSLTQQSWLWAAGYGLLIFLTLGCAACLWRSPQNAVPVQTVRDVADKQTQHVASLPLTQTDGEETGSTSATAAPPSAAQRSRWVLLSFIPSSLLLGVTTYITTDIASLPLLWAVPLAIYLLTFILTFASKPLLPHKTLVALLPLLLTPLIILSLLKVMQPVWLLLPLHLAGFFVAGCVFHGELQKSRPSSQHLTSFYLWVAFGGVLGGWFNALAAPLLFPSVLEYPLVMSLSILLAGEYTSEQAKSQPHRASELAEKGNWEKFSFFNLKLRTTRRVSLGLLFGALIVGFDPKGFTDNLLGNLVAFSLLAAMFYAFSLGLGRLVTGSILIVMLSQFALGNMGGVLHIDRSFFGVNRVVTDRRGEYRSLLHGTTLHGKQSLDPQRRREPLTYFYRTGPIGQVFQSLNASQRLSRVAVLGLGIGTLAAYSAPGQEWTFYEIDPAVEKLARNANYFTFLQDSKAPFSVVLGDARLRLASVPDSYYDLLVMDAFSSDSIPVHLVTREAIQLYFSKLTEQGLLAINISNRYINLEPVLGGLARHLGLSALRQLQREISPAEREKGKSPSHWVLLARQQGDFGNLASDSRWQPVPATGGAPLWADDFSDIFRVFRGFRG
jgi:hypothetical protein